MIEAQSIDQSVEHTILETRKLSNIAIKEHQIEKIVKHLTEDIVIMSGNGTLIHGKDSLTTYLNNIFINNEDLYFVRDPKNIEINKNAGLAWETGNWKAIRSKTVNWNEIGGNYSAMWREIDGIWKIRSQLFVTLY